MNDNLTDRTVYTGRPTEHEPITPDMRLPKEMAVYDLLDALAIPYTRIDHAPIATIEGCQEVDKLLQISLCKNLFLCNAQKTSFHLLVMPGNKRFVTKDFSKQIESPRLSFAPEIFMEQFLDITPGSVSILGLMNDKGHCVNLSIDQDVLENEFLGCHPCINTSSLRLPMRDVIDKFLPYTGHMYRSVKL
jgi:Ala-tRNA(Pro) deacylase